MTKTVGDIGGRFLGNLSYGGQRPSLMARTIGPAPKPVEPKRKACIVCGTEGEPLMPNGMCADCYDGEE